jgi:membrane protein implicated in regulation of membrane protease activity
VDLQPFTVTELITGGILLISLEVFLFSFFIIWFGFSSIAVGVITHFYPFESGGLQLGIISVLALVLFFLLAKPLKEKLMRPKESLTDRKVEVGTLKNGRILYDGTFWSYRCDEVLSDGDKVEVLEREGNTLSVKLST